MPADAGALPYLVLLQAGFAVPSNVATDAVRSYRTVSPLPSAHFCAAWAVCSLLHFPWACAPQALPGASSCGARTFLCKLRSGCLADSRRDYTGGTVRAACARILPALRGARYVMRSVMSLLLVPAVVYLAFCAYVYATQRSMIYFPTAASSASGAQIIPLESSGETLRIVAITRSGPRALIYFGGNAEDVAANVDTLSLALPEYSLYLVNYRGYGGSTGKPTEAGLFADALAIYDHVRMRHPQTSVLGRSLGSGVAVYLASQRPVDRLVLVTPFDSLLNVARTHFRILPSGLLLKDRYESASRAPAIAAPVLTVIAEHDEIIPRARSQALVEAFRPEQVRVTVIDGAQHNTLDAAPQYLASVRAFLAERPAGR